MYIIENAPKLVAVARVENYKRGVRLSIQHSQYQSSHESVVNSDRAGRNQNKSPNTVRYITNDMEWYQENYEIRNSIDRQKLKRYYGLSR